MLKEALQTSRDAAHSAGRPESKGTIEAVLTGDPVPRVKCIPQFVPTAALKQKYLSGPVVTGRYTVLTASAKTADTKIMKLKKAVLKR